MKKRIEELLAHGGSWLGEMRSFIQWRALNGDRVTWGSNQYLQFSGLTVTDLEELAKRIATKTLEDHARVKKRDLQTLKEDILKRLREIPDMSTAPLGKSTSAVLRAFDALNVPCKTCMGTGCPFPSDRDTCVVHHCPDCEA